MNRNPKIYNMVLTAVFTAVTCVLAPLSIPIGPVPISLTNLVLYFSVYILGAKKAAASYMVYMLIGFIGLPVFSGFTGGAAKLLGPTGGYIIGFIFLILISGTFMSMFKNSRFMAFFGMVLGTAACYFFGTAWLMYSAHMTLAAALMAGVLPFILGDLAKIILALVFAPIICKRLKSAKNADA